VPRSVVSIPEKRRDRMAETLVVVSKVKKLVKEAGFRTGGDFLDGLSNKVQQIVQAAVQKVQADGKKKTLGAEDL
jgi:hypothetical protein